MFVIQRKSGEYLRREPGEGDGPLWGEYAQAMLFAKEQDAQTFADRFFTRRLVRVLRRVAGTTKEIA